MAGREGATVYSAGARHDSSGASPGAAQAALQTSRSNSERETSGRVAGTWKRRLGVPRRWAGWTYGCSRPQQTSVTRFCGGEERDSR